jgi:hypothetical protein
MLSQWRSNLVVGTFVVSVLAVFLYFIMNYTNELGLFEARAYIKTTSTNRKDCSKALLFYLTMSR